MFNLSYVFLDADNYIKRVFLPHLSFYWWANFNSKRIGKLIKKKQKNLEMSIKKVEKDEGGMK